MYKHGQFVKFNYPDHNGKLEHVSGFVTQTYSHQIIVSDTEQGKNPAKYETLVIDKYNRD